MLFKVAWASLLSRKLTVLLTVASIAVSVFVMMGVEHIRQEAKNSFSKTVSGVDLIVGARTSQINLLLYTVFRIGNATNSISWESYQTFSTHPAVAWSIPISLGDSYRGYRVLGTTEDYFAHFQYGNRQSLSLMGGQIFADAYDAVLGAEVANSLGLKVGDKIVLAHGIGSVSFSDHDDKPFVVTGVLNPTGTPVDQTVHVHLEGIEAIHKDWQGVGHRPETHGTSETHGVAKTAHEEHSADEDHSRHRGAEVEKVEKITAFMIGLKNRMAAFSLQREVNEFEHEAMLAILPGAALMDLWRMMSVIEKVLLLISALVLVASLLGMSTMLLATMKARQRELAVMRTIGAHPMFVMLLVQLEALFITCAGVLSGLGLLFVILLLMQQTIMSDYGLFVSVNFITGTTLTVIGIILVAAALLALIPGFMAYRYSLGKTLSGF